MIKRWERGMRLPTEAEWEVAAPQLHWGQRWEWTESAYLPYPGFSKAPGALESTTANLW
ncbi:SUMF1/EgtB/PvdO family nonheme iron enzyme [Chitinophaga agrisoli]|uniref:SUMF1/EgtB/PvdO family nonheme iron enzyme n=1 Tax=Chitinophaga agrisoli TaxID=2607653 RepID=UPI001FE6CBA4|nr:SUMF1/EgtB/PvdO family nonheme iron enzyme [Chitinophaga agrisoli]